MALKAPPFFALTYPSHQDANHLLGLFARVKFAALKLMKLTNFSLYSFFTK